MAAICLGVSLLAFNAAPLRAQAQQQSGALPGGGAYVMRRDALAPTAAIELWFRAPGAGYENATPGISRLTLAALAVSAPPHGTSFAELVTRAGGSLSIDVYPDIAMIGASVPASQADAVVRAMTHAFFAPEISADGLKSARRDCAVAAAEAKFDPQRALQDALFARLFASGPAHVSPTPQSARDIAQIPESAVKSFAARAFRRANALLSLSGNVGAGILNQVQGPQAAGNPDAPIDSTLSNAPIDAVESGEVAGIGFAWTGPPIADTKAATAMDFIADYLFDEEHGTLAKAIGKQMQDAAVSGQFITLHDPGVLLVTVSGAKAASARAKILAAAGAMATPMDAQAFADARNAFEYHIMSQTQTPLSRADNFGWYWAEGNAGYAPGDASGEYLKAAASLDPGYVASVARKYLQHPAILQLLAGNHGAGSAI